MLFNKNQCNNPFCKKNIFFNNLCKNHFLLKNYKNIVYIQKIYKGYYIRKKLVNIFYKLPDDLQKYIIYYINIDIYYKKYIKNLNSVIENKFNNVNHLF